jgi:hypothetical protein
MTVVFAFISPNGGTIERNSPLARHRRSNLAAWARPLAAEAAVLLERPAKAST